MSLNKLIKASDVKGDAPYEVILRAWLEHKVDKLPEIHSKMLARWQMVDKLIRQGDTITVINDDNSIEKKLKRFNFRDLVEWLQENYGISARTAYDDIKNAKRFFLSAEGREDVEYARGVMVEWGEMMMFKAFDSGDFDSASKFFKELNKIKGLHEQHLDLPDYADFVPPSFIITGDPTELGFEKIENQDEVVKRILSERRKDFIDTEAEDAEVLPDE
ncbi:hypothetical protein [Mucilaginibacter sp.]|uniref:hypothetical protein n=1 Tax=Mucilaginibacter sp. TaxID=1882438 RepID=UPI0026236A77|nr:hypothetical protein [Mucilaginibacter sp.]MDB4919842.1 hypothetical protein [Mucilaginibacter sp.]